MSPEVREAVSGFRRAWQGWRWTLFLVGMVFAAIIARWFAIAFFAGPRVG